MDKEYKSKKKFTDDKIDSKFTNVTKTGSTVRSANLDVLVPIAHELEKQFDGKELLYDIVFDSGTPQATHMTYTELLSSAIYVNACSTIMRKNQQKISVQDEAKEDYCERILSSKSCHDKYRLTRNPFCKKYDSVVMLPGSNLYEKIVDEEKIKKLIEQENVAIKAHPISNAELMRRLEKVFGKQRIIASNTSGWDVMVKADKIYTTGSSETALYGVMMGKEIGTVESDDLSHVPTGAYRELFDIMLESNNQYADLNNILNSHKSGIFFHWENYPKKITKYFEHIKKLAEDLKDG